MNNKFVPFIAEYQQEYECTNILTGCRLHGISNLLIHRLTSLKDRPCSSGRYSFAQGWGLPARAEASCSAFHVGGGDVEL